MTVNGHSMFSEAEINLIAEAANTKAPSILPTIAEKVAADEDIGIALANTVMPASKWALYFAIIFYIMCGIVL